MTHYILRALLNQLVNKTVLVLCTYPKIKYAPAKVYIAR